MSKLIPIVLFLISSLPNIAASDDKISFGIEYIGMLNIDKQLSTVVLCTKGNANMQKYLINQDERSTDVNARTVNFILREIYHVEGNEMKFIFESFNEIKNKKAKQGVYLVLVEVNNSVSKYLLTKKDGMLLLQRIKNKLNSSCAERLEKTFMNPIKNGER